MSNTYVDLCALGDVIRRLKLIHRAFSRFNEFLFVITASIPPSGLAPSSRGDKRLGQCDFTVWPSVSALAVT